MTEGGLAFNPLLTEFSYALMGSRSNPFKNRFSMLEDILSRESKHDQPGLFHPSISFSIECES